LFSSGNGLAFQSYTLPHTISKTIEDLHIINQNYFVIMKFASKMLNWTC